MLHDTLTPLLLMREELQPVPQTPETERRFNSRTTIANSPLYERAIARFYFGADIHGSPSPIPAPPTPPQTQERLRPLRTLKHPPAPDGSPVAPPKYSLERTRNAVPGASILRTPLALDLDSDNEGPEGALGTEVIEIADSEPEEDQPKIPFLVVLWTMVRQSSSSHNSL